METEHAADSPGSLLSLFMRRRGWSAARLAEVAHGVSASSIRAYTADRSTPRPAQALAVANALGLQDGRALLESWGYHDLAEGFTQEWQQANIPDGGRTLTTAEAALRGHAIHYQGQSLSSQGLDLVMAVLVWVQSVEGSTRERHLPNGRP